MFSWTCPYCGRPTTITRPHYDSSTLKIDLKRSENDPEIGLRYEAISCPNPTCDKLTLSVQLGSGKFDNLQPQGWKMTEEIWGLQLLPESIAKPQPEYIPQAIRDDYTEACRIVDLSPKASATLSRRCLQGIIRDFWNPPKKPNLKQEIDAIQNDVDALTWKAIDAVREIGNIGAHMEQDINLIVDVEPEEAELLVGLIETLFAEWYVARHDREKRMNSLKQLAADKAVARKGQEPSK